MWESVRFSFMFLCMKISKAKYLKRWNCYLPCLFRLLWDLDSKIFVDVFSKVNVCA